MPTFPVDLTAYLEVLPVQQTFVLGQSLKVQNVTAGGEVIRSGGGARLWRGSLVLAPRIHAAARAMQSRLNVLQAADATFLINDLAHDGVSFTAEINFVNGQGRMSLRATGANRVLRAGDYIGFNYNGRRALHQAVEGRVADSNGVMTVFDVVPPIRPGWVAGEAVTVGAARCMAKMVPGTVQVGVSGPVATEGASFEWVQTLEVV